MPEFLVVLFWLWLAVSVGIYLYRLVTRGTLRAAPTPSAATATVGVDAATEPIGAMPTPSDRGRTRSLADALAGIEMPAELVPVPVDGFDPRRMQFFTDRFAPYDVGMSLADELERLGFEINPISDTAIRVDQAHASVEVRILADPPSIQATLGERAAAMPPQTVVVDFQLC